MRVLQINTLVNSGSTGRIAEEIGNVLLDHNHESHIAFGRGDRPSNSQLIRIGNKKDTYKHGLQTLLFDRHGLGSKKATQAFVKQIDLLQPDVIGLHNIHGYYINYPVLFDYIKANAIPVLWTFHDCWPFTGHCSFFDSVDCQKWKTHCQKCPLTSNYPKALIDRSYQNFKDKKNCFTGVEQMKIITPSRWLADLVKHSFLKEYPVDVIHNGIDLAVFKPLKNSYQNDEKIILGVASTWDKRKGLQDFIQLRKLLPLDYEIVLIGLEPKQIQELPEGIRGIQRTENVQELIEWYNKARVFVNPTYVDNFPTTNIEALACGTPVYTYNTGGSPEAIDQETGKVFAQGDVKSLADAIKELKKGQATIAACRNRAMEAFSAKERYQDYLKLYEQML